MIRENQNLASERSEDAFCEAKSRLAQARIAYLLADMAQIVPGLRASD